MSDNTRNSFNNQVSLDRKLVRKSILEHRIYTGKWLAVSNKEPGKDNKGSYILRHGVYAGKITVGQLHYALQRGNLGLSCRSSLANEIDLMAYSIQKHAYLDGSSYESACGRGGMWLGACKMGLSRLMDIYVDQMNQMLKEEKEIKSYIDDMSYDDLLFDIVKTYCETSERHKDQKLRFDPLDDESFETPGMKPFGHNYFDR